MPVNDDSSLMLLPSHNDAIGIQKPPDEDELPEHTVEGVGQTEEQPEETETPVLLEKNKAQADSNLPGACRLPEEPI